MKRILYFFLMIMSASVYAQQDFLLYNMPIIPQSVQVNPANQFNGKIHVGLPVMSSIYFSASNSGFAYSDIVKQDGDSLLLSMEELLNELDDNNYLSLATKTDLLTFGIAIGENTQLNFNITESFYFKFSYPKDLIQLIWQGNASFANNSANFQDIGLTMNHYREYGVGISKQIMPSLRVGGRLKYLYGMENIHTKRTDISLETDPDNFFLTINADYAMQTSGLTDEAGDEVSDNLGRYLAGRKNHGMGLDLGATYRFKDRIALSASVLDLGFINWKSYTRTYENTASSITYRGIDIDDFIIDDADADLDNTSLDRVADSIEAAFDPNEVGGAYTAPLTGRFYLGADYKLGERHFASILAQSEIVLGKLLPSFTMAYNVGPTHWLTGTISYTIINQSYNNIGIGGTVNPGPIQLYFISDNLLGAIRPQHSRHVHFRFGMNVIIGKDPEEPFNSIFADS